MDVNLHVHITTTVVVGALRLIVLFYPNKTFKIPQQNIHNVFNPLNVTNYLQNFKQKLSVVLRITHTQKS